MKQFSNIEDMMRFLYEDKEKISLSPLRIINVESMEMWVELKKILLAISKKHICLSSFCAEDDTTPNMHRFFSILKDCEENVCVSPLSEYLRINSNKAYQILMDLIEKEYRHNVDGKLRIYIPLYRMKSILQTINIRDPKKKDSILFLSTGEDADYSLTIIQKQLHLKIIGNEISGFKRYLQYWEQNPDKPLILHTQNAIYFTDKVFFDDVRVIVSSFDFLTTYYQLPSKYNEADGTEEYWDQLAQLVAEAQSFEAACCNKLLINKYTHRLFDKWVTDFDDFQRWLLWLWSKVKNPTDYLAQCVLQSKNVEEFKDLIFSNIISYLDDVKYQSLYSERKALIKKMQIPVPASFWKSINNLSVVDKLRVLTDISAKEREVIFNSLKDIPDSERINVMDILRTTYPTLANYLFETSENVVDDMPAEIAEYFHQYRWNKAANVLPKEFVEQVQNLSLQKGAAVYALKARNLIVSEEYDDNTAILFADGMGVEYINYICHALEQLKHEGYQIRARIGYCNLPSTTAVNKDFLVGKRVIEELSEPDEMKHGKTIYPQTIVNELRFLESLKEKVRNAFSENISRVILTTDHGTSRMAVLVRSTEFDHKIPHKGHVVYKYGRYCEGTELASEVTGAIEYSDKLIFADYQRFEQKGAPIDEIHGGASLEEWLVPIIVIDNTIIRKAKLVVSIISSGEQLRPDSMTKMVSVNFVLEKYDGEDVSVRVHGKKIVCRKNVSKYEFKYKPEKNETGTVAKVYIGTEHVGEFEFHIKQAISQNAKFDF